MSRQGGKLKPLKVCLPVFTHSDLIAGVGCQEGEKRRGRGRQGFQGEEAGRRSRYQGRKGERYARQHLCTPGSSRAFSSRTATKGMDISLRCARATSLSIVGLSGGPPGGGIKKYVGPLTCLADVNVFSGLPGRNERMKRSSSRVRCLHHTTIECRVLSSTAFGMCARLSSSMLILLLPLDDFRCWVHFPSMRANTTCFLPLTLSIVSEFVPHPIFKLLIISSLFAHRHHSTLSHIAHPHRPCLLVSDNSRSQWHHSRISPFHSLGSDTCNTRLGRSSTSERPTGLAVGPL